MLQRGKKITFIFICILLQFAGSSQAVADKLAAAFSLFEKDPQLKAAIASICVLDAKTGQTVFEKNSRVGLAPASTLKVITSVTAYELLGKDFRYKTQFGYTGNPLNRNAQELFIRPSGDPTLGSWRWTNTAEDALWKRVVAAYKKAGIRSFGNVKVETTGWEEETIPDGWTWGDIGNYYGAGAAAFNWRENQFDIFLKSGSETGSAVLVVETKPRDLSFTVQSLLKAGAKGSGDNAYVYFPLQQPNAVVRGTIPSGENRFSISASMPDAKKEFVRFLMQRLLAEPGINQETATNVTEKEIIIHTETSPPLDSIIYWFNKKSVNLYGEALIKTIGYSKTKKGATDEGVEQVRRFWATKGLSENELALVDGSGLSPENRVTSNAQAYVLAYAKKQDWFNGFYTALPEYNGMKLKSGTIKGVKAFAGYHRSKDGKEFIISFLVNNYNGSASTLVQKMYKVLDLLK